MIPGGRARTALSAAGLLAALAAGACGRNAPAPARPALAAVRIGPRLGPDHAVIQDGERFGPGDTVFVSARVSGGAGRVGLTIVWARERGPDLDASAEQLDLGSDSVAAFHLAYPGGLPPGRYRADVSLNGERPVSRDFWVR
jgi:hypothetical protein